MAEKKEYGVIHEIGDLGLGFDPVTEEANEKLNKEEEEKDEEQ